MTTENLMDTGQVTCEHLTSNCTQHADNLRAARARMATAKDRFSKAAALVLQGHEDAPHLVVMGWRKVRDRWEAREVQISESKVEGN